MAATAAAMDHPVPTAMQPSQEPQDSNKPPHPPLNKKVVIRPLLSVDVILGLIAALFAIALYLSHEEHPTANKEAPSVVQTKTSGTMPKSEWKRGWRSKDRVVDTVWQRYQEVRKQYEALVQEKDRGKGSWKLSSGSKGGGDQVFMRWADDAPSDKDAEGAATGRAVPYVLAEAVIKAPAERIFDVMRTANWEKVQPLLDPFFESYTPVKTYDSNMQVGRRTTRRLLVYGKRDFAFASVEERRQVLGYKQAALVSGVVSLPSPQSIIPEAKGYTRAWQDMVSFYIPLTPTSTRVIMIMKTDLGGNIPLWVFSQTCGATASSLLKELRKICEKE